MDVGKWSCLFEGVLKIYWGLSKPITLAPGVMYAKNRNSRASVYDYYGVDDAAYLMMLEEAAKVRKRRELFDAGEKTKLQEIAESAWDSKGQCIGFLGWNGRGACNFGSHE